MKRYRAVEPAPEIPPKRSDGQITIRLDPELEDWCRAKALAWRASQPGNRWTMSDFVRTVLYQARDQDLAAAKAEKEKGDR